MGQLVILLVAALFLHGAAHAHGPAPADSPAAAAALLWKSLSSDPGQSPDVDQLRALFRDDAVVFGAIDRKAKPGLSVTRAVDFIAFQNRPKPTGFYECEVTRSVREYGRFATVYSVVESRKDRASPNADFVGVNSMQMYKDAAGWKILSLYYYVGPQAQAVPLDGGKPGVCL